MSLAGPRAKIARAIEHRDELTDAVNKWLDTKPYAFRGRPDLVSDWFFLELVVLKPPPLRLGTLFGDFVGNLESALDHLVYQLVIASGNEPGDANYFPVATTPDNWLVNRPNKLKGVKDGFADRIRESQPLTWGDRAQYHPMVVIHAANKVNKHKVISPTIPGSLEFVPEFVLNRNARAGEMTVHDPTIVPPPGGWPFEDGTRIGAWRALSLHGDLRIIALQPKRYDVNIGVGFEFGIPVDPDAPQPDLLHYVKGVVDPFEDVLGP